MQDILSRRQHGFGVFWLAATLGSKGGTSFKKLTRKEVLGCNLVEAWYVISSIDPGLTSDSFRARTLAVNASRRLKSLSLYDCRATCSVVSLAYISSR